MMEEAEFPEESEGHGKSIRQAVKYALEQLDGVTKQVDRNAGIASDLKPEKIVLHRFLKPNYDKKCVEVGRYPLELKEGEVKLKELEDLLDLNALNMEGVELALGRNEEKDEEK